MLYRKEPSYCCCTGRLENLEPNIRSRTSCFDASRLCSWYAAVSARKDSERTLGRAGVDFIREHTFSHRRSASDRLDTKAIQTVNNVMDLRLCTVTRTRHRAAFRTVDHMKDSTCGCTVTGTRHEAAVQEWMTHSY